MLFFLLVCSAISFTTGDPADSQRTQEETVLSPRGLAPPFGEYFQRSYDEIRDEVRRFAASPKCSEILHVTTAQEMFKDRPNVHLDADFFKCGNRR